MGYFGALRWWFVSRRAWTLSRLAAEAELWLKVEEPYRLGWRQMFLSSDRHGQWVHQEFEIAPARRGGRTWHVDKWVARKEDWEIGRTVLSTPGLRPVSLFLRRQWDSALARYVDVDVAVAVLDPCYRAVLRVDRRYRRTSYNQYLFPPKNMIARVLGSNVKWYRGTPEQQLVLYLRAHMPLKLRG